MKGDDDPRARRAARRLIHDVGAYSRQALPHPLRDYQLEVARAIVQSVVAGQGLTFTVLFPRQAGKNELSAQLEAFLLYRYSRRGGSIVKAAPTFRPQIVNSLLRLEKMLDGRLTRGHWSKAHGYIVRLKAASISFFSAQPDSSIVGATASLLLEGDEAQDLDGAKWDKDLRPMAATGAATSVLYGTPWTDDTLLAQQMARNLDAERRDGRRRHFAVPFERVAAAVPAYGRHVEAEIARLGPHHPIVITQYLLKPLARADRLLSAEQLVKLRGEHPPLEAPSELGPGVGKGAFVAGLDVAGADEEDPDGLITRLNPRRDSTVLAIAYAEDVPIVGADRVIEPKLAVVRLYAWRGAPHRALYPVVLSLVRDRWPCRTVVVDATGVGSGLAAFLGAALGQRVVRPYLYTQATKSQLGYDLLAAVNGDRLKLHTPTPQSGPLYYELLTQAEAATYELRSGQTMRWSVPDARGHDDLLNALALLVQAGPLAARRRASGRRH